MVLKTLHTENKTYIVDEKSKRKRNKMTRAILLISRYVIPVQTLLTFLRMPGIPVIRQAAGSALSLYLSHSLLPSHLTSCATQQKPTTFFSSTEYQLQE